MSPTPDSKDGEVDNEEALKTPTKDRPSPAGNEDSEQEEEDQEEDEPRLKYNKLTGTLSSIYRNGDDTSCFMVAGDKMIIGTHNGNIHSLSLPSLTPLRTYHAHSASVVAVSISPIPPPPVLGAPTPAASRAPTEKTASVKSPDGKSTSTASPKTVNKSTVPNTPSNQIYIASASQDGHVCVSSLIDPKDVTLRNFARPVQAIALSPEYKYDRTYLSGGLAGSLILTIDGKAGVSAEANTNSAAAAAQGWLGTIGLSSNTGKDSVLHSGEGGIAAIKFSRTGKFVAWINEHGIKIMRSHMKLDSTELQYAWKRIAHIDRPGREIWEDMAAVWKGRIEWVNSRQLEADDDTSAPPNGAAATPSKNTPHRRNPEKLIVGWGDTAWILHVFPGGTGTGKNVGEKLAGSANIVHKLSFDDCILSGLALYTPSLLAVLAYRTRDDNDKPIATNQKGTPRRQRQSALSPELRLVEVATGEEVDVDTLTVSRYESLSVTDYHLGSLYIPTPPALEPVQRGALESLGAVGAGIWDMSSNATRIFSSGASVRSNPASGENGRALFSPSASIVNARSSALVPSQQGPPALCSPGLKLFIQTPYDCILAVKRDLSDHLTWLLDHARYGPAWDLLDNHPSIIRPSPGPTTAPSDSTPSTPRAAAPNTSSLADFFADDSASQTTISVSRNPHSALSKEKRRIADLWLQQLVSANDWSRAGQVAGKVLSTSSRWEHWILAFAQAERFDEIVEHMPGMELRPALPSFVYEVVLGHYITHDAGRFAALLDRWDAGLFDVGAVATAVETRLSSGDVKEEGDEWRTLMEGLARLKLAGGQARQALTAYIRLQNAEEAMRLVREWRLTDAIADDVPGLLMLRVEKGVLERADRDEVRAASEEAVGLLVDEAYSGIVPPGTVVGQLKGKGQRFDVFLYFYFKRLWEGPQRDEDRLVSKVERLNLERLTTEGRIIVESFADLALEVFAKFDRDLLFLYLRTSTAYTLDKAVGICEEREYIPELVFLLSKTGETKKALFLIIEKLGDVSQAIEFAKENQDLWDDLLDYSMDKPKFIRALLLEVGTSVDAIKLVKRIPDGLEIEGLKEGLQKLVKEYDIQYSISEGVAKVLKGEVAAGMEVLREGRRKGVKFDVRHQRGEDMEIKVDPVLNTVDDEAKRRLGDIDLDTTTKPGARHDSPGHCVSCEELFEEDESDFLIGFPCGHVFHLECLLDMIKASKSAYALVESIRDQTRTDADADSQDVVVGAMTRSVGPKISHAQVIRSAIGGGCPVCVEV
ncbi:Vacuolar protein sorting-associated protein 41 [Sphaceloma murrayae]|uniref:Vacuolar protein sorting-associated protein 41 n=1 Tax=Sphaceloma murrayae TaxID=2082308 RepID=A0A2K1R3I6_9PEZI|nr:Vacuolar protein sorting-associated protein 41 [Sphaceloma murrayae]